jgi:hypothetical protein
MGVESQQLLTEGLASLSDNQTITFTKYVRQILPSDGFVFWVKADLVTGNPTPHTLTIKGSFHNSVNQEMREDENIAVTQVIFTTKKEIEPFTDVDSSVIWIGQFRNIRFSFSRREKFYSPMGLYHYVGDAIYPAFESQIIDDLNNLDLTKPVASNSILIWLTIQSAINLYPSYLTPTNLPPPYGSIHVDKSRSLQAAHKVDNTTGDLNCLIAETVRIVLYGVKNNAAWDFIDAINNYCLNHGGMGIVNKPIPEDEKRPQSDINAIAQKKTITFDITYNQSRIALLSRRLLLSAPITLTPTME